MKTEPMSKQMVAYQKIIDKYIDQSSIQSSCAVSGSSFVTPICNQIIRIENKKQFLVIDDRLFLCEKSGIIFCERTMPSDYYFEYINSIYGVSPLKVHPVSALKARFRVENINLAKTITKVKINSAFEVSSFDGCTLDAVQKHVCKDVHGVEPTTQAVKCSLETYPELAGNIDNCLFEDFSAITSSASRQYDLVLCSYALQQIANPLKAFATIKELVADGGILVIDEGVFLNEMTTLIPDKIVRSFHQQKNYLYTTHALRYYLAGLGFKYLFSSRQHLAPGAQMFEHYSAMVFQKDSTVEQDKNDLDAARKTANAVISLFMHNRPSDQHTIDILKQG